MYVDFSRKEARFKGGPQEESPYIKDSEALYLTDNNDEVKIYFTGTCNREWGNKYVIAFIKKNS